MAYNKKVHLEQNIQALKVAFQLDKEKRPATDTEKETLRKYSGFGGLKFILNPANEDGDRRFWTKSDEFYFEPTQRLYELIRINATDFDDYKAMTDSLKSSVLTSFYTPPEIIQVFSTVLEEQHFQYQKMLDPSAGTGNFIENLQRKDLSVTAFEKDLLTGKVLKHLYPSAQIKIKGFENIEERSGNEIPYLERKVNGVNRKADIFEKPVSFSVTPMDGVTPEEALIHSLNVYGKVNLPYMNKISGESIEYLKNELKGSLYYNPIEMQYETKETWLAGNIAEKIEGVEKHLEKRPEHQEALEALEALKKISPEPIAFEELDFNLGERWIPEEVYSHFTSYLFDTEVQITYSKTMDNFDVQCQRKNSRIYDQYAVKSESRTYDSFLA